MQVLLMCREGEKEWGVTHADVKVMEMCWQSALNEVRKDTSAVPDRIYSVDQVETFYCVKTHAIFLSPVFVAFFDYGQDTVPMIPGVECSWVNLGDVGNSLRYSHEKDIIEKIHDNFFLNTPSESLKVYPTRF